MSKTLKRILTVALSCALMMTFAACGDDKDEGQPNSSGATESDMTEAPEKPADAPRGNVGADGGEAEVVLYKGDTFTVITVKGYGDIKIKLFPEIAPVAVQNFIDLTESGYYTDKTFHRIIPNFMIQGGSPYGDGRGSPDYPNFSIEPSPDALHFYGAFCMANAGPNNNSQQFYIVNDKTGANVGHLNGDYTVFGQTIEGFEVVDAISGVKTAQGNKPINNVVIEKVEIFTQE